MFRRCLCLMIVSALAAGSLWAAAVPPSLLPPKDKGAAKEKQKPNMGDLSDWIRSSNLAEIRDGMFYLDALKTKEPVSVFRRDLSFTDAKVNLEFKVEPVGTGDRAVGLTFGSTGSQTYHAIEIDRRDVVLYRVTRGQPRVELDRRGGFTKPEGKWYQVRVECQGSLIRVFFDNKFLFAFNSPQLQAGYVGFYANQSRAWVRRLDVTGKQTRLPRAWKE